MELLLENGPNSLQQDLQDWRLEKYGDKNILFYKDKNYIPDDLDLRRDIVKIMKQLDTLGNWKRTIRSNNIIGGQECVHLSNNMFKVVALANSSRSIEIRLTHRICQ